jgi:hypothetical protein
MAKFGAKQLSSAKLPLFKRFKRFLFNLWVSLTQDRESEKTVVSKFGRR